MHRTLPSIPPPRERSGEGEDDRALTLGLMIAAARALKAIERGIRPHLAGHGLQMTEFAVLEVLYHRGPLPLGEIRDRILVTGASTTYVVKKLERRGLVSRHGSDEDRRVVLGEITPAGRKLMDEVFPVHVEHLRHLMAGLSPHEKRTATRLMRKLGRHAGSGGPPDRQK